MEDQDETFSTDFLKEIKELVKLGKEDTASVRIYAEVDKLIKSEQIEKYEALFALASENVGELTPMLVVSFLGISHRAKFGRNARSMFLEAAKTSLEVKLGVKKSSQLLRWFK